MIGSKFSRIYFQPIRSKTKPIVARACTFSRALCRLRVITSSFDWFTGLSPSFLIGHSNYFGFGFTTLNWNSLYYKRIFTDMWQELMRAPFSSPGPRVLCLRMTPELFSDSVMRKREELWWRDWRELLLSSRAVCCAIARPWVPSHPLKLLKGPCSPKRDCALVFLSWNSSSVLIGWFSDLPSVWNSTRRAVSLGGVWAFKLFHYQWRSFVESTVNC